MGRPLLGLLILLPLAAAVTDEAGDVSPIVNGPPVPAPSIDIREVTGALDNGTLGLTMRVEGDLRPPRMANASIEYAYLFIVAIGAAPDADLYAHLTSSEPSLVVRCGWHQGIDDAGCRVTEGDGQIRGLIIDGTDLTVRVAVAWDDRFAIGGAATESHAEADPQVVAQDFTDNAIPLRQPEPQDEAPRRDRPWWQTPWLLVAAIVVGIAFGLWRRSKRVQ